MSPTRNCPDGGHCHHGCDDPRDMDGGACFRVQCCEPLSDVYASNNWPLRIKVTHRHLARAAAHLRQLLELRRATQAIPRSIMRRPYSSEEILAAVAWIRALREVALGKKEQR